MTETIKAKICKNCGEFIKPVYRDESHLPENERSKDGIFIRHDYEGHICPNGETPYLDIVLKNESAYREKKEKKTPTTQNEIDYWAKVNSKREPDSVQDILKIVDQKFHSYNEVPEKFYSHDEAKTIVWRIIKNMISVEKKDFEIDEHNKEVLVNMVKYFNRDLESKYDLNKGLLIYGNFGSGKTFMFRIFKTFLEVLKQKSFKIVSSKDIVNEVTSGGTEELDKYYGNVFCFDDLGYESSQTKLYGNVITSVEDILFKRYMNRQLTHATSNLNPSDLAKVYGERMESRFNQMFNFIILKGKDRRK